MSHSNNGLLSPLPKGERTQILPSYESLFRQVMEEELKATGADSTDLDTLTYLKRRREEFTRRGFYIRPDGTIAVAPTDPDEKYGHGQLDAVLGNSPTTPNKRGLALKVGGILAVGLVLSFFVFGGGKKPAVEDLAADETAVTVTAVLPVAQSGSEITPPPELPAVETTNNTLQTIGGLGGALTLGRPGSVEIHYQATDQTVALPIDPSPVTNKGELRYNETAMSADDPVAVWVFGTVLNYSLGIPDSLARNIQVGDRITVNTDTGRSLPFVIQETFFGNTYDATRHLSQNHIGVTLFSLPAAVNNRVAFALGGYDISTEEVTLNQTLALSDTFQLGGSTFQVTAVSHTQRLDGQVEVTVNGTTTATVAHTATAQTETVLLFLSSAAEQSATAAISPSGMGEWQTVFTLSPWQLSADLFAEFRSFPHGYTQTVYLGQLPPTAAQVTIQTAAAWWEEMAATAVFSLTVHNAGPGAVRLDDTFISLEGGDAHPQNPLSFNPPLPLLLEPEQMVTLQVQFVPRNLAEPLLIRVGSAQWEVSGFPIP